MFDKPKQLKKPSSSGRRTGQGAHLPRKPASAPSPGTNNHANTRQNNPLGQSRPEQRAARRNRNFSIGQAGLMASLLTILKGTANACARIPANPLLIGIGFGLTIASLIYLLWSALG